MRLNSDYSKEKLACSYYCCVKTYFWEANK